MKRERGFVLEEIDENWDKDQFLPYFHRICDKVLNQSYLKLRDELWKLREIEVYCNGLSFCDEFTHGDEQQKKNGTFYFHRTGKGYRGGTYKGVDLAFGNSKCFGGLLVRTIQNDKTGEIVCGPSLCVDKILSVLGHEKIEDCVAARGVSFTEESDFCLVEADSNRKEKIFTGPRVGLSLKSKKANDQTFEFWCASLRFVCNPSCITKHKQYLVLQLLADKTSVAQIATLLKIKQNVVSGYETAFNEGKKMEIKEFFGKNLNVSDICKALGCFHKNK